MKKYTYLLITMGSDGVFVMSSYETLDKAQKALEKNIEGQKYIEGLNDDQTYISRHEHERLRIPGFILRDEDILSQVTLYAKINRNGNDENVTTDRYIVRMEVK